MTINFASVRKTVAAVVGLIAETLNAGLVHGTTAHVVAVVVALAAAVGVYAVPNDKPATTPAAK